MTRSERLMTTYADPPVTFVSGSGTTLVDDAGKEYLDFLSGLAVTSLGHGHPQVVEAIAHQATTLTHVSNLFGNELTARVAEQLDDLLFDATGLHGRVFFANSGAEANECALKLARRWAPDRYRVISTLSSFHGRTLATLAATGQPAKHEPFAPMPDGFSSVPFGDLDAMVVALNDGDVAAVILECIQMEGGVNVPPDGYLEAVAEACTSTGTLVIVDEIQTGLGRSGAWFGFEEHGLTPDIVTMAKSLGNGFPVGACWARSDVADAFHPGDHGSTFGGQPLAMAAVSATLDAMIEMDAPRAASEAGSRLTNGLSDLAGVASVRGRGLLVGAVLERPVSVRAVSLALEGGLVVNAVRPDVIRLTPPLTVSAAEIDEALIRLGAAIHEALDEAS